MSSPSNCVCPRPTEPSTIRSEVIGDFQEPYGEIVGDFAKVSSSIHFIAEIGRIFGL